MGKQLELKFLEVDEEEERVLFSARRAASESFTSGFKVPSQAFRGCFVPFKREACKVQTHRTS